MANVNTPKAKHDAATKWLKQRREALRDDVLGALIDEDGNPTGMPSGAQIAAWGERLQHQRDLQELMDEFKPATRGPRKPKDPE